MGGHEAFLGIDVGSPFTNVIALSCRRAALSSAYLRREASQYSAVREYVEAAVR
ncbi:MAG: hypothetical protein PHP64_00250 [Actinomycetota bacterium]|nr:hypothetical protein [Actinomycetota bacterium]